ncbi:MAG: nuclear transport factor 2 family protein [bacterium]
MNDVHGQVIQGSGGSFGAGFLVHGVGKEENKKIVLGIIQDFSAGRIEAALGAFENSATWRVSGNPSRIARLKSKKEIAETIRILLSLFPKGLKLEVDGAIEVGDFVAVEGRSRGEMATGKVWEKRYHYRFEIQDGKVHAVKEFPDTCI